MNQPKKKLTAKEIFDSINNFIRGTESSVVNLISAVSPWGAPVPVAYMTYAHCVNTLHFPGEVAFITALVVEALGISSISTALSFWSHNKKYTDKKDQAPLILAVVTFLFYIGLVLTINVVLDVERAQTDKAITQGVVVALGLLTLLSIPAGVLLATRAQQTEILNALEVSEKVSVDQAALDKVSAKEREERERIEARQRFLDQQEYERQVRQEQAEERERLARIDVELKIQKAAIRKGIWKDSAKVSESFGNPAGESSDFVNFPRNWRKMMPDHKQTLAILISEKAKEDVAATLNVSTRTVENWMRDLTAEGYLQ